jgi:hypothetical protein
VNVHCDLVHCDLGSERWVYTTQKKCSNAFMQFKSNGIISTLDYFEVRIQSRCKIIHAAYLNSWIKSNLLTITPTQSNQCFRPGLICTIEMRGKFTNMYYSFQFVFFFDPYAYPKLLAFELWREIYLLKMNEIEKKLVPIFQIIYFKIIFIFLFFYFFSIAFLFF